jgi:hypothetical protein
MAKIKRITAQRLLRSEDAREWRYAGTRDELIAAGLALDGDFPGDPGATIYSHTIKRDDRRTHMSIHSRMANPITFWLVASKEPISVAKAEMAAKLKREREELNGTSRSARSGAQGCRGSRQPRCRGTSGP